MTEKKYDKYIAQNIVHPHTQQAQMYSPFLSGNQDFWRMAPGAVGQFAFYYIHKTGMFAEGPHTHKAEELLMFISSDPKDMKNLGATVEIAFDETWEKYSFNYSTFVRFPEGVIHCPVYVRNIQRPFFIGHFWPGGEPAHFDMLT
jgi:hypothetical protein